MRLNGRGPRLGGIQHEGQYPSNDEVKRYGHDLSSLLAAADRVAERRDVNLEKRLPKSEIHDGIVGTLSNFATNLTRYYNLDLVTGAAGVKDRIDPIVEWLHRVTEPVHGTPIQTPGAAVQRTAETEFVRRWERMYALQCPYFSEFFIFSLFHNSDTYFRNRKTWSILKPLCA